MQTKMQILALREGAKQACKPLSYAITKALNRIFFWSFDNIGNEEKNVVKID